MNDAPGQVMRGNVGVSYWGFSVRDVWGNILAPMRGARTRLVDAAVRLFGPQVLSLYGFQNSVLASYAKTWSNGAVR